MADLKTKVEEEIFVSELHQSIRNKLDPNSRWLSNDQILQILRIAGGDRRRSVHKCLLAMLYRAMREKQQESIIQIRHKLTAFEDERLAI